MSTYISMYSSVCIVCIVCGNGVEKIYTRTEVYIFLIPRIQMNDVECLKVLVGSGLRTSPNLPKGLTCTPRQSIKG